MLAIENYPANLRISRKRKQKIENPKIEKKSEKEPSEELLKIKKMLQILKNKKAYSENPEKYLATSKQGYKDFAEFIINNGGELVYDINDIYKKYLKETSEPLIVRREDPEKVAELSENFDIKLSFDPQVVGERGNKYVNCAIWPYGKNPVTGIRNAFLEGRGMAGPLVSLVALRQNPKNNKIKMADNASLKIGNIEREAVRIATGNLTKNDLKFIILRIQKKFFPNENLLPNEKNNNVKQIFRGFSF